MIRVLVFIFSFSSFIYSNNVLKPIFPKGERLNNFIINSSSRVIDSVIANSGKFIVSIEDYPSKLKLWDTSSKKIFYVKNTQEYIKNISITENDKLLVYCSDNNITFFDLDNKKVIKRLKSKESIKSLTISADGKYLLYTTKKKVYLYNIKEEKNEYFFEEKEGIEKIIISYRNSYIVVLTKDEKSSIKLYDLKTSKILDSFNLDNKKIRDIDISSDEKSIGAISFGALKVIDIQTKEIKMFVDGYFDFLKFSFDTKKIITCSYDKFTVWDRKTVKTISNIRYQGNLGGYNFSLSRDNKFLSIANTYPKNLFLINLISQKIFDLNKFLTSKNSLYLKSINKIISIDYGKGIKFWDLNKNRLDSILEENRVINDIAISSNNKYLIYSIEDTQTIKVIDLDTQKKIYEYVDKDNEIRDVAINSDNSKIAYTVWGKKNQNSIVILDVNQSKVLKKIDKEYFTINFIDKNKIYMNSDKESRLFDISNNEFIFITNMPINFHSNLNYYEIRLFDKNCTEVRETSTQKIIFSLLDKNTIFSKDADIMIIDIIDEYIFIKDFKYNKIKVWNIRKQEYQDVSNLRKNFKTIDWLNDEVLNVNKSRVEKSIYIQKNNNWMIIDKLNNRLYRNSLESLFLNSKTFEPITFQKNISSKDIEVYIPNNIKLSNNLSTSISIQIKNISKKNLYWIEPIISDNNFTLVFEPISILKPNEIKNMKILLNYNDRLQDSFSKDLKFKIAIGGKVVKKNDLIVDIKKRVDIELDKITLEDEGVSIKFKKFIDTNLTNVKITLSEGNKSIENNKYYDYTFPPVETNSSMKFYLPSRGVFYYLWDKGHDFTVTIKADEIKLYTFTQHVEFDMPTILYMLMFMPFFLLLVFFYYIYMGFFIRDIKIIMNNPPKIFDMQLNKLPYYKKLLKRRMEKDYYENSFSYILSNDIDSVSKFFKVNNTERAKIISEKINGKINKIDEDFFELTLDKNFRIKVKKILLYFPLDSNVEKIYKTLENKRSEGILVIAKNEKEQQLFADSLRLNGLPNVIVTMPKNIKIFLLQENHSLTMSKILSLKLDRKIISPYKTKNGVQNESYFFGREKILQQITERDPSNYLIVGARQIGKTSILFALERIFKFKNELKVIAITLSSGSPIRKIALKLNMDRNSTLEDIEEHILHSNKPYIFLIDEVDAFIKNQEKDGYRVLDTFRSLSQEGKAYFIMAGFWELYYQATYDYQSPIKNFGEIITVDKLEDEACLKLLLEPMSALNLNFKNPDKAPALIITALGKRANLIAKVADEIVENLDSFKFEIDSNDIRKALSSRKVIDNCKSWQKLTNNKFKTYIDKFIIYHTIGLDSFTIRTIINIFKEIDVEKVTIDDIKESLDRLELSYILAKEGRSYFYTIPLFQNHLQREEIKAILDEMIDEFRGRYDD